MSTGIRLINCQTVTINNFRFDDIDKFNDPENNGFPSGIGASNSSLTIQNIFSNNASCSFNTCNTAIRSVRTGTLIVKDAKFNFQRRLDIEVVSSSNSAYNVVIKNNQFSVVNPLAGSLSIQRAAFLTVPFPLPFSFVTHTDISNNIFSITNTGVSAIDLQNTIVFINMTNVPGALDQARISNNQMTSTFGNGPNSIAHAIFGIEITGNGTVSGYHVYGNSINFSSPSGPVIPINNIPLGYGIFTQFISSGLHEIGPNNTIISALFPPANSITCSWLRCGIHSNACPTIFVCSNDI
jgi:hypothetical protein